MVTPIIVYTTVGTFEEAEKIAEKIIDKKLGACIQIEKIKSFFYWDNKIDSSNEARISIKTFASKYEELENFIKENNSYDLPEIVSVKINNISKEYLNWMLEVMNNG